MATKRRLKIIVQYHRWHLYIKSSKKFSNNKTFPKMAYSTMANMALKKEKTFFWNVQVQVQVLYFP